MAKPEWGTKRRCDACGAPFYDLNKRPVICPKCATEIKIDTPIRAASELEKKATIDKEAETKKAALLKDDDDLVDDDLVDDDLVDDDLVDGDDLADDDDFPVIKDDDDDT